MVYLNRTISVAFKSINPYLLFILLTALSRMYKWRNIIIVVWVEGRVGILKISKIMCALCE